MNNERLWGQAIYAYLTPKHIDGVLKVERLDPQPIDVPADIAGDIDAVRINGIDCSFTYNSVTHKITINAADVFSVSDVIDMARNDTCGTIQYKTVWGIWEQTVRGYSKILRTKTDLQNFGAYAQAEAGSTPSNWTGLWDGSFILGNNINYNDNYTPFGSWQDFHDHNFSNNEFLDGRNYGFKGIFDGDGHNIDTLRVGYLGYENGVAITLPACAFISLLHKNGIIKNISFTNAAHCFASSFLVNAGCGTIQDVYISMGTLAVGNSLNNDASGVLFGRDSMWPLTVKRVYVECPRYLQNCVNWTPNHKTYALGAFHEGYGALQDVVIATEYEDPINLLSTNPGTNQDIVYNVYTHVRSRKECAARHLDFSGWVSANSNMWTVDSDGIIIPRTLAANYSDTTVYVSLVEFSNNKFQATIPFAVTNDAIFLSMGWQCPTVEKVFDSGATTTTTVRFTDKSDWEGRLGKTQMVVYDQGNLYIFYCYTATKVLKTRADIDNFASIAKAQHTEPYLWGGYFVLGNNIQYGWGGYNYSTNAGYRIIPEFGDYGTMAALRSAGGDNWPAGVADWNDTNYVGFDGVFDGNGYNIEGLETNSGGGRPEGNGAESAFIGLLHQRGIIKNLSFTHAYCGPNSGFITSSAGGIIQDVYVHADYQASGMIANRTAIISSQNHFDYDSTTKVITYTTQIRRVYFGIEHIGDINIYSTPIGEFYDGTTNTHGTVTAQDPLRLSGGWGNDNSRLNNTGLASGYYYMGVRRLPDGDSRFPTDVVASDPAHWLHAAVRSTREESIARDGWVTTGCMLNQTFWKLLTDGGLTTVGLNGSDLDLTHPTNEMPQSSYMIGNGYWFSSSSTYNTIIASNNYVATKRFIASELPIGSYITIASGYRVRPEAWATDAQQPSYLRPPNGEFNFTITDAWWKGYLYRAFNIGKTDGTAITQEEANAAFKIYIPNS